MKPLPSFDDMSDPEVESTTPERDDWAYSAGDRAMVGPHKDEEIRSA